MCDDFKVGIGSSELRHLCTLFGSRRNQREIHSHQDNEPSTTGRSNFPMACPLNPLGALGEVTNKPGLLLGLARANLSQDIPSEKGRSRGRLGRSKQFPKIVAFVWFVGVHRVNESNPSNPE